MTKEAKLPSRAQDLAKYIGPDCPKCGSATRYREGRTAFWGCFTYPRCKGTLPIDWSSSVERTI